MTTLIKVLIGLIGGFALMIGVMLYSIFTGAFIAYKTYNWFILPVFPDLPLITVTKFAGIIIFIGTIKYSPMKEINSGLEAMRTKKDKEQSVLISLLIPWFALGIAYLFKIFLYP